MKTTQVNSVVLFPPAFHHGVPVAPHFNISNPQGVRRRLRWRTNGEHATSEGNSVKEQTPTCFSTNTRVSFPCLMLSEASSKPRPLRRLVPEDALNPRSSDSSKSLVKEVRVVRKPTVNNHMFLQSGAPWRLQTVWHCLRRTIIKHPH